MSTIFQPRSGCVLPHPCTPRPARRAGIRAGFLLAAIAAQAGGITALAEESALDPVQVTAARGAQALADTIASVTVLTRADIDASQSRDLVDLLGRQPGIEFARNGAQGAQASLFVRGTNANQVLVLLDGVPLNSALDGAANLGGVATDSIERIEIVRGNLSSLYGSEAIGGVIQVFTRAGTQPGAGALLEAGGGRTRDAAADVRVPLGGGLFSLAAGSRSQQAVSAIDAGQVPLANPDLDGNHNRNGALRWSRSGDGGSLRAWAWGNRNDTDFDDPFDRGAGIPSNRATQVEHAATYGYGLAGERVLGASRLDASAALTRDDSVNVSNVPFSYDNSQFRSRNRQFSVHDRSTLAPGIDVAGGLEHLDQYGASTSFDPSFNNVLTAFSRRVDSAWLETTGRRGSQQWQASVRRDRYSDAGSATTGQLGWGWSFAPGWKLTAQAASAFRAPSFNELYYPVYGNAALRPEHARSQELGLRWAQGGLSASASVFRNRTSDLIVGLAPTYQSTNIARAALDGSEWQAAAVLGAWHLGTSLSLDRPRDLDTGLALLRRAHVNARASAAYAQGPWGAGAEFQHSGARDDVGILSGERVSLAAYNLARCTLQRAVGSTVHLHLRVENLFNAHYRLVDGYNPLPRTVVAGMAVAL